MKAVTHELRGFALPRGGVAAGAVILGGMHSVGEMHIGRERLRAAPAERLSGEDGAVGIRRSVQREQAGILREDVAVAVQAGGIRRHARLGALLRAGVACQAGHAHEMLRSVCVVVEGDGLGGIPSAAAEGDQIHRRESEGGCGKADRPKQTRATPLTGG